MVSQAERDAEVLKDTFNNLTESIRKSAKESSKLKQTFLDLSSTANASGQAWTVVSRLTSGTGFWKIQNRIRAISNFFNFQEKKLTEQVERETKQIQLIKDQITERERLAKAELVLNKIRDGSATSTERQAFFMSDQFKYLEGIFGRTKAMATMTTKIETAQKNLIRNAGIRSEIRGEAMRREFESELNPSERFFNPQGGFLKSAFGGLEQGVNKIINNLNNSLFMNPKGPVNFNKSLFTGGGSRAIVNFFNKGGGFEKGMNRVIGKINTTFQNSLLMNPIGPYQSNRERIEPMDANNRTSMFRRMTREQQGLFAELTDTHSNFRQLQEDVVVALVEQQETNDEYIRIREEFNTATDEADKVILRAKLTEVSQKKEEADERAKSIQQLKEETLEKRKGQKKELESQGIKTGLSGDEAELKEVDTASLSLFEQIRKTNFFKKWETRYKALKGINFKGIFASLMTFLRAAIIYGGLIIGLLFLLKQLGVIDFIIEYFKQVASFVMLIYEAVVEAFGKLIVFGGALFNFLGALFTGNRADTTKAFGLLIFAFGDFLLNGIGGILTTLVYGAFRHVVFGIIPALFAMLPFVGEEVADAINIGVDKFVEFFTNIPILGSLLKSGGAKVGATVGFAIGGVPGAVIGGLLGYGLGEGINYVAGAMADGGHVGKTGTYLVGERGPELVSLAAGQFVTPNHQLGGTINITVNGRIGASETELRDIGNRLGDIINNRGNRVGNTRMFR